jgi:glutathione S-transferase
MPLDPKAPTVLAAMRDVPSFAHGLVRDLRVRWALEEIGRPYRTQLFEGMQPRPEEYRQWQPFGQIPAFDDGTVRLFETGAILLYLGEQDEVLLPRDPQGRWSATAWLIAALNSVEPMLMQIVNLDIFNADQPWAKEARPAAAEFAAARLASLSAALGDNDWLAGRFTIADIMMVTVLRNVRHTGLVSGFANLAAYQARGEARPAFLRALADQADDLGPPVQLEQAA